MAPRKKNSTMALKKNKGIRGKQLDFGTKLLNFGNKLLKFGKEILCPNASYLSSQAHCGHPLRRAIKDKWLNSKEKLWHAKNLQNLCSCSSCQYLLRELTKQKQRDLDDQEFKDVIEEDCE